MSAATDVDVIVVGSGGCGLAAGLAVADTGASVVVLEKMDTARGNTYVSTGSIPGAGTTYQRAAGIEDDPARMEADLLRQSGPHEAEDLTALLSRTSASLVEWLVEDHAIGLQVITEYKHVGHSVPRLHAPADKRGASLMKDLLAAADRAGVDVLVNNPVTELLVEDGAVVGVHVDGPRCGSYDLRAGAVILAANGFGNSSSLRARFLPDVGDAPYLGAEGSTGEAMTWAMDLGAATANMEAFQGYAAVADPHGSITSWTTVEQGAVLVDPDGRRMGDESVGYSGFAAVVSASTTTSWVVMDAAIRERVAAKEPEFAELVEMSGVREAETAEGLAEAIGCDAATLRATLDAAGAAARGESDDELGRTDWGYGALATPLCAVRSQPALFHTQGGVRVDADGRVLRADGSVVEGLYAGGGVAAGISGRSGGAGYSSGNGLLTALGLGRLAGDHAGRRAASSRA
ncbi:FAD-dependent oxidoreductase [Nocardioides hwasunensis]|uniref:FAD-dependent oxidoreductase n=1 Tax=Nocardioides hwasunensis TaxID=397258 RepID=A0ABR8MIB7_9ACTN|nr:FAD-dependent oxidoreductase [Nocardioides hwasunensis]MBD3915678.1 FAD-dependent oxidoreductase [Nocardioides hwasunensis]